MIDTQYISQSLSGKLADQLLKSEEIAGIPTFTISPEAVEETMLFLKETPGLEFDYLTDLCGIHYPDQPKPFGVIYLLQNLRERTRIRIKTFLEGPDPAVNTVTTIFSSANWMERETYDFYGITFTGHPNLKRILNVEYLDYYPMRKEYPLEDPTREDKDNRFFGREA